MSVLVFAGAAQFAAVGYVARGLAWPGILLLTALLNARHLLYSAALAPWVRDVPLRRRAAWPTCSPTRRSPCRSATSGGSGGPTNAATGSARSPRPSSRGTWPRSAGVALGGQIADPTRFGLDIVFPAAMIGLAAGLSPAAGRSSPRPSGPSSASSSPARRVPAVGIIAGGLVGPLAGLLVPARAAHETAPLGTPSRPSTTRCGAPTSRTASP